MKKILIAGESWMSYTTHVKGFDSFTTSTYEEGVDAVRNAFRKGGYEVDYIPNHLASARFPMTLEEMSPYSCIVLSDIGSNTLLLSDNVFSRGRRENNRLDLIRDYVAQGGGFLMIGGYMSFTGIDAKSRYGETAIAEILPVELLTFDDRIERPEGVNPVILQPEHPVFEGIDEEWPHFLGYNKTLPRVDSGEILALVNGDPFVGIREYGKGRTGIFSSDCAPHWGPVDFTGWKHYDLFWQNLMDWLVKAGR